MQVSENERKKTKEEVLGLKQNPYHRVKIAGECQVMCPEPGVGLPAAVSDGLLAFAIGDSND